MLKKLTSLKSASIAALLLALGMMMWVDPTTRDGDIALVIVSFLFFTLILRGIGMLIDLIFDRPAEDAESGEDEKAPAEGEGQQT
ncbi:hypothetical protein [Shimia sp.]|uniref:hypothetical protein n=1 Tax=Shimia sp. TaxID=1954381 RepID=UPI003BAAC430